MNRLLLNIFVIVMNRLLLNIFVIVMRDGAQIVDCDKLGWGAKIKMMWIVINWDGERENFSEIYDFSEIYGGAKSGNI